MSRVAGLLVFQIASPADRCGDHRDWRARHRLPAICPFESSPTSGGLMSYGADPDRRQSASGASYVIASSRARSRPTCRSEQPTKFELVINLKTAKALGLECRDCFLLRADEVIE